jgi:hypothetical protein
MERLDATHHVRRFGTNPAQLLGLCCILMIENDSERLIAFSGGKVAPLPTAGGKSLPPDSDSFLKRIAHVITYHAPCRHAHPAGSESASSWPWRPWPQKGLGVGSHFHFRFDCQFYEHRGDSHCGWDCAKPSWQLVQFAAAGHRRHTLGSGYESGGVGDQRGHKFPGGGRSPQDQCHGLIPRSRIAASSCSALKGLLKNSMDRSLENLPRSVAWS